MSSKFDLICIGSGPAGQRAAVQASKLGKKVALIEKSNFVGGICLHTGTVPSKTLRESILFQSSKKNNFISFSGKSSKKLFNRVQKIVDHEVLINNDQLARNRIKVFHGEASFINQKEILIKSNNNQMKLKSSFFLISVGTSALKPNGFFPNNSNVITSDEIFALKKIPNSISIIGCGVIGIEYASMFANLGVDVTVIDGRNKPLEFLDTEIVDELIYQMRRKGVKFKLGKKVANLITNIDDKDGVLIHLNSGKKIFTQLAIVCAGRVGSTNSLNLINAKINVDEKGRIIVNKKFQTSSKNIYAAGDVIGFPSLAATSFEQGRLASLFMFDEKKDSMSENFPVGVYSIPEVSMVGMPEHELKIKKIPYETGIARYKEISRGNILEDKDGLLKIIFHNKSKKVLGVHIVGTSATELIHIGQCVMELGGNLDYFLKTVFNYPTLAECYKVAALNASNKVTI